MLVSTFAASLLALSGLAMAVPAPTLNDAALEIRANKDVNPAAVKDTTCTDKAA